MCDHFPNSFQTSHVVSSVLHLEKSLVTEVPADYRAIVLEPFTFALPVYATRAVAQSVDGLKRELARMIDVASVEREWRLRQRQPNSRRSRRRWDCILPGCERIDSQIATHDGSEMVEKRNDNSVEGNAEMELRPIPGGAICRMQMHWPIMTWPIHQLDVSG
jgi:hypothetical protein